MNAEVAPTQLLPIEHPRAVRCLQCGYDLRTHDLNSICPECQRPVQDSLQKSPALNELLRNLAHARRGALAFFLANVFAIILLLGVLSDLTLHGSYPGLATTIKPMQGLWQGLLALIIGSLTVALVSFHRCGTVPSESMRSLTLIGVLGTLAAILATSWRRDWVYESEVAVAGSLAAIVAPVLLFRLVPALDAVGTLVASTECRAWRRGLSRSRLWLLLGIAACLALGIPSFMLTWGAIPPILIVWGVCAMAVSLTVVLKLRALYARQHVSNA